MAAMPGTIRTALIAGGGIAGPTAGIALTQAGIEVTVYEAYQSSASGVGGALSIAPNGLDALDAIGAGDAVRRVGTPIASIVLQSWTGRTLAEFGTPPGMPTIQFVSRSDLYCSLGEEAHSRGVRIVRGQAVGRRRRGRQRHHRMLRPGRSRSATRPLWRATPTSDCGSWPKPFGRTEARLR
jgi:2-polyprenyl-6-methoxyphenol hydroxylase-like FAD-dependent oxidoreductase